MRGTRQHSAQEAIRVHSCPSEAIRGHQRPSEAIRGHREDLCGNRRQTNATTGHRGHQWQSEATTGHRGQQWQSEATTGHRGHQWQRRREHLRKAAQLQSLCDRSSCQVIVQPQVTAYAQGGCSVCRRRPLQPLTGDRGQAALVSALELGYPCVQRVPDEGDHQRSSEVIRGHQRSSEIIRGHQRSSEASRGTSSVSLMAALGIARSGSGNKG